MNITRSYHPFLIALGMAVGIFGGPQIAQAGKPMPQPPAPIGGVFSIQKPSGPPRHVQLTGVLVRIQAGADIKAVAAAHGAYILDGIPNFGFYILFPHFGLSRETLAQSLTADTQNVVYAEEDSSVTSAEMEGDPFHFSFDRSGSAGAFTSPASYAQVNLGQAKSLATGLGVIVAVLDTGVNASHPALAGHCLPGYNVLQPSSPPDDIADGRTNNDVGHGTMIAGLIAYLAPNAAILPVRVMNGDGIATMFDVLKGMDYAVSHGARVITMSFGAPPSRSLSDMLDAVDSANVVLVAAAGNSGTNTVQLPARGHGALAVASVEANNTKSAYSNYGSFVRVVAPGTGIRSAFWDGGYASWSGTSFATPMVAAEAALMLSANPALLSGDVVSRIRNTARSVDNVNPNFKGQLGNGVIDIEAAVKAAMHH